MPVSDGPPGGGEPTELRPSSAPVAAHREARFTPGTMLAGRYRIVAHLGSGGMGEVYRAEDVKLGQQVALKFLPHAARADPRQIERLYAEVRLGRQVSHPNVCRLYDIGEWEGNHFLAMEYVDGEDLASLLRRIGKLQPQKAIDIARNLCEGIAAAHVLGIVHRDLKPANVMIDGRGQARITDFGLAVVAQELGSAGEVAGTPAYMAPEQLTGGEVSPKTDLYALGVILYEVFTGKRLFQGELAADVMSRRLSTKSHSISTETRELDPAMQRVIARCLEVDPAARPASIHAVIASLPGGDPLQAALDAGETPSPQMVAAAGEVGELEPAAAWTLLFAALLGLIAVSFILGRTALIPLVSPKPPEVLAERARAVLVAAGYDAASGDSAWYFDIDERFFKEMIRNDSSPDRWTRLSELRPDVFTFGYRESPESLVPENREGRVTRGDPPMNLPGMTHVEVDAQGRLVSFAAVPPEFVARSAETTQPDWKKFFELAGGDLERLQPVAPQWAAPVDTDAKFAWDGFFRGDDSTPIRIEAASYGGKPVWFRIIGPWESLAAINPASPGLVERVFVIFFLGAIVGSMMGSILLARRNLRRGRGDRRTATRLAIFVFLSLLVGYIFRIDHVSMAVAEWVLIQRGLAFSLFYAVHVVLLYLAIEPYIRRRWPHTMIGWSRLFAGRFRDPMIGRDLAVGAVAGIVVTILRLLSIHAPTWIGQTALSPMIPALTPLTSSRGLVFNLMRFQVQSIQIGLLLVFILLLGTIVFRRRWAAIGAVWLFASVSFNDAGESPVIQLFFGALMATVFIAVLIRFGLLALVVGIFFRFVLSELPITLDPSVWYFGRSLVVLALLAGMIGYGFYTALGEKPLLRLGLPEDT